MSMGAIRVYIPPTATPTNEISTLNTSGTGGAYFIHWSGTGGYQGYGWFWDDPNNHLKLGWENLIATSPDGILDCGYKHTVDFNSFKKHVEWDKAQNLNEILGTWDDDTKLAFLKTNNKVFQDCVY